MAIDRFKTDFSAEVLDSKSLLPAMWNFSLLAAENPIERHAVRPRHRLYAAVAFALGGFLSIGPAHAAPVVPLSSLDGSNGFRLDGVAAEDRSGRAVSGAGDINGDGISDLIIGAYGADPAGDRSGSAYVLYGRSAGDFASAINLSTLDGSNGFRLDGAIRGDYVGFSVAAAGDVNGDDVDDLIIGAFAAEPTGNQSGSSFVVFGRSEGTFSSVVSLSTLDGENGFRLDGNGIGSFSGFDVATAGDVNGDGVDDMLIGAPGAFANGIGSGASYVVFGRSEGGFAPTINVSTLNGSNGFRIDGVANNDQTGFAVSTAGDVNGDGVDDLVIGAWAADPNGEHSGSSYVVFGRDSASFASAIHLSTLDGSNGFRLDGVGPNDLSGRAVSGGGDVNGDGVADVIIGAYGARHNGIGSGSSYIVFGRSVGGFGSVINLSTLDGTNGFRLDGDSLQDSSGGAVANAGDINGDGADDLIIGANAADPSGASSGSSYVVFGRSTRSFASAIDLSSLDGKTGFRLDGEAGYDYSGLDVSSAGDINGDGLDDLIIGAFGVDGPGPRPGRSYVVYGSQEDVFFDGFEDGAQP